MITAAAPEKSVRHALSTGRLVQASMDTYSPDGVQEDDKVRIRLDEEGQRLTVSCLQYGNDGPEIEWIGRGGNGHWELECAAVRGKATLHSLPNSLIFEGFWRQEGYTGMWRIEIEEDEVGQYPL